jgi:hypothetical protein
MLEVIPDGGWWRSGEERRFFQAALDTAPTLLESYFWGFLFGCSSVEMYLDELLISDLEGPGDVPDDSQGEP